MLDNHLYNLFSVITEESRSLWRLKNEYKPDTEHCEDCKKLCAQIVAEKEEHINKLQEVIKKHLT